MISKVSFTSHPLPQGPSGAVPAVSRAGPAAVSSRMDAFEEVRRDLTLNPMRLDFRVSPEEARHAFETLVQLQDSRELSTLLVQLPTPQLNRLVSSLAKLGKGTGTSPTQSPLVAFLTQVSTGIEPGTGEWVQRLGRRERRLVQEALLLLPHGSLLADLRRGLGEEAFESLIRGDFRATNIGHELLEGEYYGDNVTAPLVQSYQLAKAGRLPPSARYDDFTYVIGPGLFGVNLPGYHDVTERGLAKLGVSPQNIVRMDDEVFNDRRKAEGKPRFNTAASSENNAQAVRDRILELRAQGKQVILLGHSKFGSDLREMFGGAPELANEVAGVILMQPAPSAQIAPDLQQKLSGPLKAWLKLVGGDEGAFDSLSHPSKNASKPWLGDEIPTVVFASSSHSPFALLKLPSRLYYGKHYGTPSDGLVPWFNQAGFAGAALAAVPGMADHAHPAMTFRDFAEHFASQLEQGQLDHTLEDIVHRIQTDDDFAALRPLIEMADRGLTPDRRPKVAAALRKLATTAEAVSGEMNAWAGYPLLDAEALTQSLVHVLVKDVIEPRDSSPGP